MKPKFYILIVLCACILLMASCKSAGKLYNQGNYDEAVAVAAKKLQKKPGDQEMSALLQNAYHYAANQHENKIAGYAANTSELKYERIYHEYEALQNLYYSIYRIPAVYELVKPADYSIELNNYREKAGNAHAASGIAWMKQSGRENAKRAVYEFQQALAFLPGNIKIQQQLDDAYDAATLRVAISPVINRGIQFSGYYPGSQNPAGKMADKLIYNPGNQFVKFYPIPEVRHQSIETDQLLELNLNDITMGRLQEERHARTVIKEVVIREIVYKPDSVVKIYGKVKANIITSRKSLVSGGSLDIVVRDSHGNSLWRDNVYSENKWVSECTTFTGDERALTEEDKHLINRRPDNIPGETGIIDYVTDNLFNTSLTRIRDYYSRY